MKKNKKKGANCTNFVKDRDSFGIPVGLTYQGETHYKTLLGGIATIAFSVYVGYVGYYSMMPAFLREIDTSSQ